VGIDKKGQRNLHLQPLETVPSLHDDSCITMLSLSRDDLATLVVLVGQAGLVGLVGHE
jgi:hypothetical protein